MLEEITQALSSLAPRGAFCARTTGTSKGLSFEVSGIGPVALPISPAMARRLCAVGRPARYGLREKTLRDTRVRDTWEIPARRIRIHEGRWGRVLHAQLARLQRVLGLPPDRVLVASLHNLLVYEPGQFFATHQDSEKQTGMIGTLIVLLPSRFTGGELVVEHHGEQSTHRGSASNLTFIAFYADCHHQVRTVRDGYRVALTYNLLLEASSSTVRPAASPASEALLRSVKTHFETPRPPRWGRGDSLPPPDRLVYLLDHQYTQSGLGWDNLKNADAGRAAALRQLAADLGCEIFLALADVHESWSCEDDWYGHSSGERWRRGYETDDVDGEVESPEGSAHTLIERIDWDVELRHWLAPAGRKAQAISSTVDHDEICFTKPSVDLEPFRSEHEGYMGNYGNTVDRWYHRAAIVIWPRERTFIIRAKAAPSWALREVSRALKAGRLDEARTQVRRLAPFWDSAARRDPTPALAASALAVALGVDDPELATSLLRPLSLEQVTPKTAPAFRALLDRYGAEWCCAVLAHMDARHPGPERDPWLVSLPASCRDLMAERASGQHEVAEWLVASQLKHVAERFEALREELPGKHALDQLVRLQKPLLGLLESSHWARSQQVRARILELVCVEDVRLLSWLIRFLRTARDQSPADLREAMGLSRVEEHCRRVLRTQIAIPSRRSDDWSVAAPSSCDCPLCKKLGAFLTASDQIRLDWPLAEARRSHVHGMLDRHDLPVTHVTTRSGRPYTLVLTKKPSIFDHAAAERKEWEEALRGLDRNQG